MRIHAAEIMMEIVRIPTSLEKETRGHLEIMFTVPLEKELLFVFHENLYSQSNFCWNIFLLKFTWEYISAEILKHEDCTI